MTPACRSIAAGCSSRTVMPLWRIELSFLLHTPQQKLSMLFRGLDNPTIAPSPGDLDPHLIMVPWAHISQLPNGI